MKKRARDFDAYLRRGRVSPEMLELRLASEAVNSGGGYVVPPGFEAKVAVAQKEYSTLQDDMEQLVTSSGQPDNYPANNPTALAATIPGSEGTQVANTDQTYSLISFPVAPMLGFKQLASAQLVNDSGVDFDSWISARLGEALGRGVASYAVSGTGTGQPQGVLTGLGTLATAGTVGGAITATGGYVTLSAARVAPTILATSGTELAQNVLAVETLAAMVSAIDPAYLTDACWYMSPTQWANTLLLSDSSKRPFATFTDGAGRNLMGFPVKIVNVLPALTASTVGGPLFGSMRRAFIHRVVSGTSVLRSEEQYADALQVAYVGFQRHDIRMRDGRALVTVKAAAT